MKRKGFKLLALAVITACCFGISAASAFAAEGETKTVMNGASIRTIEPTGLRFEAVVDAATYDGVIADGSKSFGAFILPKDYLTAANITAITNHKDQFVAPAVEKYLEKEDIAGELKDSVYTLKYSIADLHYYNYNRVFVGMFFIKTVGADNAVSYQYFTVNAANNERSVAFVAKAAVENGSEVPDIAYDFLIAAKYLEVHPYDSTIGETTQKSEADAFVTANKEGFKTAYTAIKTAADIETINILDATQKPKIQAARTAYDGADTVIQNLLRDFGIYNKFVDNETAYQQAESAGLIETVNNAIAALPEYNVSTVPVVYNKNYKTAKAAYDKLTDEQKPQITNYAKLQKYVDAAANAKLVYADNENSIISNTTVEQYQNNDKFGRAIEKDKATEFGYITKVWCNGAGENVRLKFNGLGDLSTYDVVRFPIYLDSEEVGTSTWPLVYKFKDQSSIAAGYRTLKAGWNIVTVPVSKVADGIEIGANGLGAGINLYYAIPYAEKLERGDAIASYKYESFVSNAKGDSFVSSYVANIAIETIADNENGTVAKVTATTNSENANAGSNYAFKVINVTEMQAIASALNATSVKFKIKANKESSLYMTASSGNVTTISLKTTWLEVELTAKDFAKWNGYFRKDWATPIELQLTDFVIVK